MKFHTWVASECFTWEYGLIKNGGTIAREYIRKRDSRWQCSCKRVGFPRSSCVEEGGCRMGEYLILLSFVILFHFCILNELKTTCKNLVVQCKVIHLKYSFHVLQEQQILSVYASVCSIKHCTIISHILLCKKNLPLSGVQTEF